MKRSHYCRRLSAILVAVPVLWGTPVLWAQDLEFAEDQEELIFEEDEEELIFEEEMGTEEEVIDTTTTLPFTTGFVVPNDLLDSAEADELSLFLLAELQNIPTITVVSYDDLRQEFEIMGSELALECAFDPVCLGRVGDEVGLDQIVIGRATESRQTGEVGFTMDLVDVATRTVLRYRFVETASSYSAISSEIQRQLPYLFAIQQERPETHITGPTGPGTLQVVASWATLALGVASLGVGIYFGVDASSIEDEVRNGDLREGDVYTMTQIQAQQRLNDAEDSALLSNIFLGSGVALLGVSALLFLITPGSDIDVEAESVSQTPSFRPTLAPAVTQGGWGLVGGFEF